MYKRQVYDQIASIEVSIAEVQTRMDNIRQRRISTDNVYQFLLYFDKLYDQFTDLEKKTFMNSFIERVEIYPERQSDGRIVKRIEFRFPVYFKGSEMCIRDSIGLPPSITSTPLPTILPTVELTE